MIEVLFSHPGVGWQALSFLGLAYGAWWSTAGSPVDRHRQGHILGGLGVGALAVGLYCQWPAFLNPDIVNDDCRQHLYWMRQFHDPQLFQNDLLSVYAKNYQPWGFFALYRVLALAVDPVLAGKILTVVLLAAASSLVYVWLVKTVEPAAAFLGAMAFALNPFYYQIFNGGYSRAFGFPLLLLFLTALAYRRPGWIAASILLAALFYPPVFLISAIAYLIVMGLRRPVPWRSVWPILVGFMILSAKTFSTPSEIGSLVARSDIVGQPEFSSLGRYPVWPTASFVPQLLTVVRSVTFDALPLPFIGVLFVGMLVVLWRRRKSWLQDLSILLAASLAACFLARALLLRLFVPERYLQYGIPFVIIGFCVFALDEGYRRLRAWPWRPAACRAAMMTAGFFAILQAPYGLELYDMKHPGAVFSFLKTVDKNALIAAFPTEADNIPVFAQRKIFIGYELSHPWYDTYWKEIRRRTTDFFDAYYSENLCDVASFCEKYGIDYIVVNRLNFSSLFLRSKPVYFEPFQSRMIKRLQGQHHFALASIRNSEVLFRVGPVYVISASMLRSLGTSPENACGKGVKKRLAR